MDILQNSKNLSVIPASLLTLKLQWKSELEEILEVAFVDGDPWVAMMAEILKTYPATGALNMEIGSATDEDTRRIFNDLCNDLRKLGTILKTVIQIFMVCVMLTLPKQ